MKLLRKARSDARSQLPWPKPRVFAFASLLVIGATLPRGCTGCRVVSALGAHISKVRQSQTIADPPAASRIFCPTLNSSPVQAVLQGQSGHRAILSWRASAAGDAKHDSAVGYCIYRVDEDQGKGQEQSPQLINSRPFEGTRCADDWVKNAGKYHYLVRAISPRWTLSEPSNVAHAAIPGDGQRSSSPPEAPAPLCREPTIVK
jgi:hypothetical protein